jgi:deazaflavin-dependent oxidoreductase (nitroreductase family)
MTAVREQAPRTPPRFVIRIVWMLHRTAYRITGGRFGLSRPEPGSKFGMLRLATVGRRSGQPRVSIIGYYDDGPNLVTLAMNGWGRSEPAWWLNLQAQPDTTVGLADGPRAVRARAAEGSERERLWSKFRDYPGWGDDIDALAARRPMPTAVVVLEPRSEPDPDSSRIEATPVGGSRATGAPTNGSTQALVEQRPRPRLRHLWVVPGLAIAVFANMQAGQLGVGIIPLLVFGIVPDLTRLLGLGQPHAHGQMAARAVPAFNLMHHPLPPLAVLALAAAGVLPPVLYVGALAWLGHIVVGLGVGDRLRSGDGFLPPLWPIGRPRPEARRDRAGASTSAESPA